MKRALLAALCLLSLPASARPGLGKIVSLDWTFPNGDRIAGYRLDDPDSPLGSLGPGVTKLIARELGPEVGATPIHVLPRVSLAPTLSRIGDRAVRRESVDGFEYRGHVFVRRGLMSVPRDTLVHEVIHVASEPFAVEASARGWHLVFEGITEYFTQQLLPGAAKQAKQGKVYLKQTEFAEVLSAVVGRDRLAECFFSRGGLASLERAVNRELGPGRFQRAVVGLEHGRALEGMELLSSDARR